jgi:hypothetical protein
MQQEPSADAADDIISGQPPSRPCVLTNKH